jgi:hypothetical protein
MNKITSKLTKGMLAAIAAAALFTPAIASAQDYAYNDNADQQIQGTISSINGTWNISVADANGYRDNVALHQGTVINPTGLTLEPGMNVTIDGYANGPEFEAMEIDTPYHYQGPAPTAVYYGGGAWYPGYAAGWGPSFSLFFDLNSHRYEQRSFAYGGQIRRSEAPPSNWQNQPHGFIGNNTFGQNRGRQAYYNQGQQQRNYAPQQQTQQRTFAPQPQQQRNFAPQPQQQRTFAAQPQQQRSFAAPQQREMRAAPQQARAPRENGTDNGHRRD